MSDDLYRLPTARPPATAFGGTLLLVALAAVAGLQLAAQTLAPWAPASLQPWLAPPPPTAQLLARLAAALLLPYLLALGALRGKGLPLLVAPLAAVLLAAALGPLYPPTLYILPALHPSPALARPLLLAHTVFFGTALLALFAAPRTFREIRSIPTLKTDNHGSARWATAADLLGAKLLDRRDGLLLGYLPSDPRPVVDDSDSHLALIAPSGSGKTTAFIIPALHTWRGPTIALDVKGELYETTAGFRSSLGQTIYRFDPTDRSGTCHRWNPLDRIPLDDGDFTAASLMAHVLATSETSTSHGDDSFWTRACEATIGLLLLHVRYTDRPTLAHVYDTITSADITATLERMATFAHDPSFARGWRDPETDARTFTHPSIRREARQLAQLEPRTRDGILATAKAALAKFGDPVLLANTEASDFDLTDLLAGERASLYITIPPTKVDHIRPLLRIFVSAVLDAAVRRPIRNYTPRDRLLLILDEFPTLGRLELLQTSLGFLRGYGVKIFLAAQTLGQIQHLYGRFESILPNCRLNLTLAPADLATSEHFSRMTGAQTVHVPRRQRSSSLRGSSTSHSETDHARPLLTPDEVRRLPRDQALLFAAGVPVARLQLNPYFRDPQLIQRASMPPPHRTPRPARAFPDTEPVYDLESST